jgi:putative DNA primase/helicase
MKSNELPEATRFTASEPATAAAASLWIWPTRIPSGSVSVVVGQAGAVTSLVGSTIVATIVNGGNWPHSEGKADRGRAVVIAPADVLTTTIEPQLDAAGALPKIMLGPWNRLVSTIGGVMKQLAAAIEAWAETRMLMVHWIIDQVDDSYAQPLHELDQLAKQCGVAVLIVAHQHGVADSKGLRAAIEMFAGWSAVSSVFHVALDYESGRHLVLPVKNALGYETMGFAFHVQSCVSSTGAQAATLEWDPTPVGRPPIRSAQRNVNKGYKEREAMDFVQETLRNGEMPGKALMELAVRAGISPITCRRSVEKLRVVKSAGIWRLPKPESSV